MNDKVLNNVPREMLERVSRVLDRIDTLPEPFAEAAELRALLSEQPQASAAQSAQWPTTPGLSVRPSDDDLWDQTLSERDSYHESADKLTDAIAKYFGQDFGEHSSLNAPWENALEFMRSLAAQSAPDERAGFDEWYIEEFKKMAPNAGVLMHMSREVYWTGWQARAAWQRAQSAPAGEREAVELALLREYRLSAIAFSNSQGVETYTLEEAVEIERKAEARFEAAEKACWDFYGNRGAAWQRTQSAGVPVAWFTNWPGHRVYAAEPHGFDEPGLHLSGDSIAEQWHPLYAAAPAAPTVQGDARVPEAECRRLLFAFGLECNTIGLLGAAENLHKGMKAAISAAIAAARQEGGKV